jgi:hypothetical protein
MGKYFSNGKQEAQIVAFNPIIHALTNQGRCTDYHPTPIPSKLKTSKSNTNETNLKSNPETLKPKKQNNQTSKIKTKSLPNFFWEHDNGSIK